MKVGFGADHAGFELKQHLMETARSLGHEPVDYGTYSADSVDYPDFAEPVARDTVAGDLDLGVVICSNGVGVSIVANKVPGARAALCHTGWGASRARQHTDANVLALGAWEIGRAIADECLTAFLAGSPEEGNHARRRDKLAKVERRGIGAGAAK
ncbi:MAG: RpiB/LacA/LacB family sugar-phosphate isomerase [Dehalococcoidia bacterium]|nr:RpiB/LacA/LacB family sugar-phosphate isomerase [Dehalococcoidia bacterium]